MCLNKTRLGKGCIRLMAGGKNYVHTYSRGGGGWRNGDGWLGCLWMAWLAWGFTWDCGEVSGRAGWLFTSRVALLVCLLLQTHVTYLVIVVYQSESWRWSSWIYLYVIRALLSLWKHYRCKRWLTADVGWAPTYSYYVVCSCTGIWGMYVCTCAPTLPEWPVGTTVILLLLTACCIPHCLLSWVSLRSW